MQADLSSAESDALFSKFDRNGDGAVDIREFRKSIDEALFLADQGMTYAPAPAHNAPPPLASADVSGALSDPAPAARPAIDFPKNSTQAGPTSHSWMYGDGQKSDFSG